MEINSIKELESLPSDGIYSLATIEWWLLKYQDEYNRIKEEESKRFMYFIDGKWVRLPDYFDVRTLNEKFLRIYNTLNKISDLHKHENYFKQEIAIYKEIENKPDLVKQWIKNNEKYGPEEYPDIMPYLDYNKQGEVFRLSVYFSKDDDLKVYIDKVDFKYTIEFLEVFISAIPSDSSDSHFK